MVLGDDILQHDVRVTMQGVVRQGGNMIYNNTTIITGDYIVNKTTYGAHKNLPGIYFRIFTINIRSYSLWPPVIYTCLYCWALAGSRCSWRSGVVSPKRLEGTMYQGEPLFLQQEGRFVGAPELNFPG